MDSETITRFFESSKIASGNCVRIDFKKRNPVLGLIVKTDDYEELKSKNFWRIVVRTNIEMWQKTKSVEFAKIYSGSEFSKLSVVPNVALV